MTTICRHGPLDGHEVAVAAPGVVFYLGGRYVTAVYYRHDDGDYFYDGTYDRRRLDPEDVAVYDAVTADYVAVGVRVSVCDFEVGGGRTTIPIWKPDFGVVPAAVDEVEWGGAP